MLRNALVSYALFQDWGNDPLKYERDDYRNFLGRITNLFPPGEKGPNATAANDIEPASVWVPVPVSGSRVGCASWATS